MTDIVHKPGFKLKEDGIAIIVGGTALGLGSYKSGDPTVVIPMLLISAASFLWLCWRHKGRGKWRAGFAAAILITFSFVGWRLLHPSSKDTSVGLNAASPIAAIPTPSSVKAGVDAISSSEVSTPTVAVSIVKHQRRLAAPTSEERKPKGGASRAGSESQPSLTGATSRIADGPTGSVAKASDVGRSDVPPLVYFGPNATGNYIDKIKVCGSRGTGLHVESKDNTFIEPEVKGACPQTAPLPIPAK